MSRNEAENKVWEVDSDIIARESARDRRETAAETVRRRKKKSFNLVQKTSSYNSSSSSKLQESLLFAIKKYTSK